MAEGLISDRASLIKRASYLRLATVSLASAMQSGAFRSLHRGRGMEFSGVREYLRGDDVRAIDWNVTARMGRPYVKMFDEDREVQVFLIVDRSLSMQSASASRTRLETATEIAALLVLCAEHNINPVGAVLFTGSIEFAVEPKTGGDHTMLLLSQLDSQPEQSRGSVLAKALQGAGRILKNRSLVFVISDFRVNGWEDAFAFLALRHDTIALRITDGMDFALPQVGTVFFRDVERGMTRLVPTSSKVFKKKWREDALRRERRWNHAVIRRGGIPLAVSTADDTLGALSTFFAQRVH